MFFNFTYNEIFSVIYLKAVESYYNIIRLVLYVSALVNESA